MTFGSQNWPIMEASPIKSWRFLRRAPVCVKIDKEITSILKWPGKIQSYISLSSVFSFFRHSVSVVRLTVGRWVRQSVGQSLSLSLSENYESRSVTQPGLFFVFKKWKVKKKGCFITKQEALNVIAKSNRLGENIPGMLTVVMTKALTTWAEVIIRFKSQFHSSLFNWLWWWLPLKMSKRQSPLTTTVHHRSILSLKRTSRPHNQM